MAEIDGIGAMCAKQNGIFFAARRSDYLFSSDLRVTVFFVGGIHRSSGSNVGTLVGSFYSSDLSYYVVEVNNYVEQPV